MVSVCLTTYNGEKFIYRQLESILSQLSNEDEIIISDDNSTDNTRKLLGAIHDRRIKLVINQARPGPVGNFQNAIIYAKGDYILLSDQDDVWLPDKVSIMCKSLEKYDLVLTDCEVVDKNLKPIIPSFFSFRGSRPGFWYNVYRNSYIGCCMGFRREILTYILPFPDHIHMHDWWIGLLVEARGRVKFIPKPLLKYVRHGDNASPTGEQSNNNFWKQLQNRLIMLWYIFNRQVL